MHFRVSLSAKKVIPDVIFFGIFFFFLIVGLFLGDGKQPHIDTLASIIIISLYFYANNFLKKYHTIPRIISILWGMTLVSFVISIAHSTSIGFSITTTFRILMGYLIFKLFYEYSSEHFIRYFINGLTILSLAAIFFSFYFIIFPSHASILPSMNLLYANYGHNHLVGILFFVFPISLIQLYFSRINMKQKKQSIIHFLFQSLFFLLIITSLFFTFSRGAFLLLGLYTIFQSGLFFIAHKSKKALVPFVLGFVITSGLILFSLLSLRLPQNTSSAWLERQIRKPILLRDGRIKYWNQAVSGIKEHPLFGTGPGTFILTSKRYQKSPTDYSWFAHNSLLQWIVELGFIGSTPILLLITFLLIHIIPLYLNNEISQKTQLSAAILISFLSSLYDFTFDFLLLWVLFWALIGTVLPKKHLPS